ncbi:hypothetical protein [Geodermatophilus ruber]|uniref:Uncharacterized protein n=1 Tax=Geodermatophilus ruber TaxID=504800 RepID=A0A1I4H3E2_9ACTN|nr:hypothetical protein [Geodermatophilus ruber]SFL36705.1 hypothetical protein SAMN04488085_11014 [Geodermatophilus ruber]
MPETTTPESTVALPAGFEHLSRYASWVLPTERERIAARLDRPYPESVEFYKGMLAEQERIMSHLLTVPVAEATPEDMALMHMTFAFLEIANAVEVYGESEVPDGADLRLFVSTLDGQPARV